MRAIDQGSIRRHRPAKNREKGIGTIKVDAWALTAGSDYHVRISIAARARVGSENQRPWPADKVERWAIDRLIPYAKNARTN